MISAIIKSGRNYQLLAISETSKPLNFATMKAIDEEWERVWPNMHQAYNIIPGEDRWDVMVPEGLTKTFDDADDVSLTVRRNSEPLQNFKLHLYGWTLNPTDTIRTDRHDTYVSGEQNKTHDTTEVCTFQ